MKKIGLFSQILIYDYAPKTSTQKWQKTECNFSSNFLAQKGLSGLKVFKNRKFFEKNWWEHGSFDFFSGVHNSIKKKI